MESGSHRPTFEDLHLLIARLVISALERLFLQQVLDGHKDS